MSRQAGESNGNVRQSFLEELATTLHTKYGNDLFRQKIIFPNKRAGLFFNQALKQLVQQPVWSPEIMSFEELVKDLSPLTVPDKITLTFKMHEVFQKHSPFKENFEQFFFWGDLLIKDFNDVDQYMADARPLFANLAEWKALSASTDFLSEDQIQLITQFWSNFEQRPSEAKEKFRRTWDILYPVYQDFRKALLKEKQGYTGMLYRNLAEQIEEGKFDLEGKFIFAGFNALTKAEESIMAFAVAEKEAEIFWDIDAYYAADNQSQQEAGNFFRDYKKHRVLGKTFPEQLPDFIGKVAKEVNLIEVSGNIGQTKLLGEYLKNADLTEPEKTAIILGDESLLFSVLHAIPESINKVNVTMGYPLKFAPIFSLLVNCLYLQKNMREVKGQVNFNHRDVVKILKHPLVSALKVVEIKKKIHEIEYENKVRVDAKILLNGLPDVFQHIFSDASNNHFSYLKEIIFSLYPSDEESIAVGFFNELHNHIARLEQIVEEFDLELNIDALIRLVNRIVQSLRVPFSGEPLEGLQLMGVLESRNLDFDEVHLLSMNEDNFPAKGNTQSFIPFNIRKAYGLPTMDQQDAIYAYLFYRLLHRSNKLNIYYNTEGSGGRGGEASRFIKQLIYEVGDTAIQLNYKTLAASGKVQAPLEITIPKNDQIKAQLKAYSIPGKRKLSASALKIYLDCRLKFYYRYIAGLTEPDEVSEELDAAAFGNILHNSLEDLYRPYIGTEIDKILIESTIKKQLKATVEHRFAEEYGSNAADFIFEGRNIIARDMLMKMINKMLDFDGALAPFTVLELEKKDEYIYGQVVSANLEVFMDAKIDRLDKVGNTIRVIDYKSGGDELKFPDIPSLFDREHAKRNGAAMQTMFYSYLYYKKKGNKAGEAIQPGLYAGKFIFKDDFSEKLILKEGRGAENAIIDAVPYMASFEEEVNKVLTELFASEQPFDQTEDLGKCKWCPYSTICHR